MGTTPTTWTRIWRTLVVAVLAVGVASATTVLEWGSLVTLVLTMAFIGGTYGALWAEAFPEPGTRWSTASWPARCARSA